MNARAATTITNTEAPATTFGPAVRGAFRVGAVADRHFDAPGERPGTGCSALSTFGSATGPTVFGTETGKVAKLSSFPGGVSTSCPIANVSAGIVPISVVAPPALV